MLKVILSSMEVRNNLTCMWVYVDEPFPDRP